jgi:hypothetical protein
MGTATIVGGVKTLDSSVLDGRAEVVVGNSSGMRTTVKVFTYFGTSSTATLVRTFLPFSPQFRGGISLSLARVNSDLVPDIIVAAGNGGSSQIQVLNGITGNILVGFTAYTPADKLSNNAPVHVTTLDTNGDGIADVIVTAQGSDGASRKIRKFDAQTGNLIDQFMESSPVFCGAYFVANLKNRPAK